MVDYAGTHYRLHYAPVELALKVIQLVREKSPPKVLPPCVYKPHLRINQEALPKPTFSYDHTVDPLVEFQRTKDEKREIVTEFNRYVNGALAQLGFPPLKDRIEAILEEKKPDPFLYRVVGGKVERYFYNGHFAGASGYESSALESAVENAKTLYVQVEGTEEEQREAAKFFWPYVEADRTSIDTKIFHEVVLADPRATKEEKHRAALNLVDKAVYVCEQSYFGRVIVNAYTPEGVEKFELSNEQPSKLRRFIYDNGASYIFIDGLDKYQQQMISKAFARKDTGKLLGDFEQDIFDNPYKILFSERAEQITRNLAASILERQLTRIAIIKGAYQARRREELKEKKKGHRARKRNPQKRAAWDRFKAKVRGTKRKNQRVKATV